MNATLKPKPRKKRPSPKLSAPSTISMQSTTQRKKNKLQRTSAVFSFSDHSHAHASFLHREEEAAFEEERKDALGRGTTWQRVAELCDLQDSRSKTNTRATKDVSRMKELFLALKREGDTAPGGECSSSRFFFLSPQTMLSPAAGY